MFNLDHMKVATRECDTIENCSYYSAGFEPMCALWCELTIHIFQHCQVLEPILPLKHCKNKSVQLASYIATYMMSVDSHDIATLCGVNAL